MKHHVVPLEVLSGPEDVVPPFVVYMQKDGHPRATVFFLFNKQSVEWNPEFLFPEIRILLQLDICSHEMRILSFRLLLLVIPQAFYRGSA